MQKISPQLNGVIFSARSWQRFFFWKCVPTWLKGVVKILHRYQNLEKLPPKICESSFLKKRDTCTFFWKREKGEKAQNEAQISIFSTFRTQGWIGKLDPFSWY